MLIKPKNELPNTYQRETNGGCKRKFKDKLISVFFFSLFHLFFRRSRSKAIDDYTIQQCTQKIVCQTHSICIPLLVYSSFNISFNSPFFISFAVPWFSVSMVLIEINVLHASFTSLKARESKREQEWERVREKMLDKLNRRRNRTRISNNGSYPKVASLKLPIVVYFSMDFFLFTFTSSELHRKRRVCVIRSKCMKFCTILVCRFGLLRWCCSFFLLYVSTLRLTSFLQRECI